MGTTTIELEFTVPEDYSELRADWCRMFPELEGGDFQEKLRLVVRKSLREWRRRGAMARSCDSTMVDDGDIL